MSLLAAQNLRLQYHGRPIFDGDSVTVERKDRLGVVGPNGSGKSTLLRMLVGESSPDSGKVVRARGLRIGYLPQELASGSDQTLLASVLAAAPRRAQLEERLEAVQRELEQCEEPDRQLVLSGDLSELHQELVELDRDYAPHHARRILLGLGFSTDDFDRSLREFSGGWRMRAALAGLLFQQPEVLLLDEPTNHLDMPSVNWLNRFLDSFPHSLVLVCHDREFLNRHANRVASFEVEGLRTYRGNYNEYLVFREQELEMLENRARRDEQRQKELEAFITRFRAKNTKARQAQSKARLIEKMKKDQVEVPTVRRSIRLKFPSVARSGDPILEINGLGHAYDGHRVLSDVDLTARRGDRIAIVGLNGAGKTTLLKLIAGELSLVEGAISYGARVGTSYFAQHHAEVLDPAQAVIDEVWHAAPGLTQSQVRGICGAFLFSGEEVEKKIGILSGGEKTRVAMARMLVKPGNLLLLDEPTNHLDTESSEKLTESLLTFDGTILFVSHNINFARRLSNKVWDVRDGTVSVYPGSLADYLDQWSTLQDEIDARELGRSPASSDAPQDSPRSASATSDSKEVRVRARQELVTRRKERGRLEKKVVSAEADVTALETRLAELEAALGDPAVYDDRSRAAELGEQFSRVKLELEQKIAVWEDLSASLEAIPEE